MSFHFVFFHGRLVVSCTLTIVNMIVGVCAVLLTVCTEWHLI